MKLITFLFCILNFNISCIAQKIVVTDSVLNELDTIFYYDQVIRKQFLGPEGFVELKKLSKDKRDSINIITEFYDSVNFEKLKTIVSQYGFIGKNKKGIDVLSLILLHNISIKNIEEIDTLLFNEIQKNRMNPETYAQWKDRHFLYVLKQKQLYGEYNSKYPCVEDLIITNEARKKIKLKPLKKNTCE